MPKLLPDTFTAWINKQPGSTGALHVKGQAEVPTSGWTGSLKPASLQGINKSVRILEAAFVKPGGLVNDVISKIPLEYTEDPAQVAYTEVTLRYEGKEFTVDVTQAQ
jgi:hypothetical protein